MGIRGAYGYEKNRRTGSHEEDEETCITTPKRSLEALIGYETTNQGTTEDGLRISLPGFHCDLVSRLSEIR